VSVWSVAFSDIATLAARKEDIDGGFAYFVEIRAVGLPKFKLWHDTSESEAVAAVVVGTRRMVGLPEARAQ
jgi:hypothetical protein